MKKIFTLLTFIMAALATIPAEAVTLPDGEPALTYKSARGQRTSETNQYVQVYLKSSVDSATFYLAIDEDTVVEYDMIKKATLYNKKIYVAKPEVTVRIWGSSISFVNINTNDAYDVVVGESGKATITEFRCEGDSITSLDFVNDMTALTYLYTSNNKRLKNVNIKSNSLTRLKLNAQPSIETLTLDCPNVYEFNISENAYIETLDFSKTPKLQTLQLTSFSGLKSLTLGTQDELKTLTVNGTQLEGFELTDLPALTRATFNSGSKFKTLTVSSCPKLSALTSTACAYESFTLTDAPALTSLSLSNNYNLKTLVLDVPTLTSLTCDNSAISEVDLSKLTAIKYVYLRNGVLEKIKLSEDAQENTLINMYLTNNQMALVDIPARGTKMQPSSSFASPSNYYAPQRMQQIPTDIAAGESVDMSKYLYGRLFKNDSTVASEIKWYTIFEEELKEGTDYTVKDGVYTFIKPQEDSVCCIVSNPEFSWFKLYTDSKGVEYDYRLMTNYMFIGDATGVDDIAAVSDASVRSLGAGAVEVTGTAGDTVTITDIAGRTVAAGTLADSSGSYTVPAAGIYVVTVGKDRFKVLVK